ncbi:MAG: N-acetyl-alpha-D-glucosaminyl L-malate synthase BshA [Candidatus Berkelbacteria bacterium]
MKILITCYASHGGSGTLATELGLRLAKRGHQIHFVSTEVPYRLIGSWKKNIFFHEVETMEYPLFVTQPTDLALANKIAQVAEQYKIDLIHGHYAIPHFPAMYLAKKMLADRGISVKTISTFHGTDVYLIGEDPTLRDIVKFSAEHSNVCTTVSKSLATDAKEIYGLKKMPKIIYNFVTITPEKRGNKELREIFAPKGERIITHMSNFREIKRIPDVVRVFANVNKKIPSRLILIGDGPERNTAYKIAKQLNVLTKIHFLGLQTNIAKLLSISDLFILPSEKESFGLSALEAMASGVPVIATNTCGLPEVIEDGKCGYLSPIGDIKKMTDDTIELLTNHVKYKKFSDRCKTIAESKFDVKKIIDQYEKLYSSLIG